ncbi:MAG: hypothetical protein P8Y12_12160 [Gammaproteobacteria bacterium]
MSLPELEIRQYFSGDVCQEADKNRLALIQDGLVGSNGNITELGYFLGDMLTALRYDYPRRRKSPRQGSYHWFRDAAGSEETDKFSHLYVIVG